MAKIKNFIDTHKKLSIAIGVMVLIILPLLTDDSYIRGVLSRIIIYATIASGLNIINGYSGQSCLGIVGFTCIGAYCSAILATTVGMPFWLSFLLTIIFCIIMGFIVSLPILKLNGMFLSIITLGFSEMMRLLALNWQSLTNGPIGINSIPNIEIFGLTIQPGAPYYYMSLVILLLVVFILHRLLDSRIGRAWISIREDQDAARSLGIGVAKYRCINFVTGATICGAMGVFIAHYYRYLHPDMFILDEGFSVLSMVIIGGSGTLIGPIVGAFVINAFTEGLRFASDWRLVMYAVLIIFMMWFRPQGLFGAKDSVIAGQSSIDLFAIFRKKGKTAKGNGKGQI